MRCGIILTCDNERGADCFHSTTGMDREGVARTVHRAIYAFSWALFFPCFQAQRHQVKNPPARQKQTPGIIQRALTIHKHLGTPAIVVCGGPLHRVKSPETERCRTVRAPCDNTF